MAERNKAPERRPNEEADGELQAFFVVIRGPLGSGKTTISKELSRLYDAVYISVDEVLDGFGLEEWEDGYIAKRSFLRVNEIVAKEAIKHLDSGKLVIFDGNFYFKDVIVDLMNRLNKFRGIVLTLTVPLEECIRRDSSRHAVLGEEKTRRVYKKSTEFRTGIEVDADKEPKEIVRSISRILNRELDREL
ncbi:MAG: AAA family ATPase [Candidatus Thermoplasmatota archaeon]|jgi:tRNA uridine 5-carbamoylmethylation protein Kti12|nr:AAA family ATPase [Candidatus Thermoplasmatota archaeon]